MVCFKSVNSYLKFNDAPLSFSQVIGSKFSKWKTKRREKEWECGDTLSKWKNYQNKFDSIYNMNSCRFEIIIQIIV
jgi:hypothetical protein